MRLEIEKLYKEFYFEKYQYEKTGFLEHLRTAKDIACEIRKIQDLCEHHMDDRSAYDQKGVGSCLSCGAEIFLIQDLDGTEWDWKYPAELEVKVI